MSQTKSKHVNLGCRLNAYETEAMREIANSEGLDNTMVVNTCAVTAEAVRKSKQVIRKLRRNNPDSQLIATGCAVQIDPDGFESMPEIDTLLGNSLKLEAQSWHQIATKAPKRMVSDIMEARSKNKIVSSFASRSRSLIQVQNGCDHRCTFCVIPYGRGNSRSVAETEILKQVEVLVDKQYKEIVLSGVDITAWGEDLPHQPRLGSLVQNILKQNPDLQRLRVSSVDPVELDDQFIEMLANDHRLMPHLHLSVQAGDDLILKRMKRRHLRDDVIHLCQRARQLRPDISFGADLIVGFPTETEWMFQNTLRLVEECNLTWLHVFPYSRRSGTPAARMPQVDGAAIRQRSSELRQLGQKKVSEFLDSWVGKSADVLMETPQQGRTAQFARVDYSEPMPENTIQNTRFVASDGSRLNGIPV